MMCHLHLNLLQVAGFLLPIAAVLATVANHRNICATIDANIPGRIGYPGGGLYNSSQSDYYTDQERDLSPNCIFRPQTTAEVSQFMKLINPNNNAATASKFAVRSGGHMFFPGAANINCGVTVDMRGFNSVVISKNRQMVGVGGGSVFSSDVYPELVPHNLTVLGGRFPGIAVGGFTTGGGVNFLSRKYGWSCDNVYGYEIVLADGKVVYATASQYSDLWLALKGGSFNFGIITRFDMAAFELGDMWAGIVGYNYTQSNLDAEAKAFSKFMDPKNFDPLADVTVQFIYAKGTFLLENGLFYSAPVAFPKTFQPFTSIPSQSPNSLGFTTISDFVTLFGEVLPASVPRAFEVTYAYKNADAATYSQMISIWETSTLAISNITGLEAVFLLQPLPVTNGTNSLGLPVGETDLVMGAITAAYANAADDCTVMNNINKIMEEHLAILSAKGLDLPFTYLNYANPPQDPFTSYGGKNKAQLKNAAKKYDPTGIFQTAAPGGWKLSNTK